MKPDSMDLRQRVLQDCESGLAIRQVAHNYRVSTAWSLSMKPGPAPTWPADTGER